MTRRGIRIAGGVSLLAAAVTAAAATAASANGGFELFKTRQASMLNTHAPGSSADPMITVGDTLKSGYRFEAIPDGLALRRVGFWKFSLVDVLVNHETSTVPFPYVPAAPTKANSQNDFDNAQVSRLTLTPHDPHVLAGRLVIRSEDGYQRFCSSYLATRKEGFSRPLLFTNEEAVDWINREGTSWPSTTGAASARQAGVTVAYDPLTNRNRPIWGMGRFNHENTVPIPGYGHPVLLSGDDTFASNPAQSQVYSYMADSARGVWDDDGDLWAFVSDNPAMNDYYDFAPNSSASVSGHFVKVPRDIAEGRKADGTDLVAADKDYPPPPATGWALDANGVPVDGPQWVLENWSDANNVFQFVRIEDMAYDKRPGMGNVVYMADTGRGSGAAPNGRIWKMVLNASDPTKVDSLSILIDGDGSPLKMPGVIHQPDNLETTPNSLLVTEDPGSGNQFPFDSTDPNATPARIWRYDHASGAKSVVASVNHGADNGPTDKDGAATKGNLGNWEASGIVDASEAYGPGAFLVTVQAHTLFVEVGDGPDLKAPAGPDWLFKREGGQLALLRIPGT